MMIKNLEELKDEARNEVFGAMTEEEPLEAINVAEFILDRLYDRISFDLTEDDIQDLTETVGRYV
jgi:hypothetical protein